MKINNDSLVMAHVNIAKCLAKLEEMSEKEEVVLKDYSEVADSAAEAWIYMSEHISRMSILTKGSKKYWKYFDLAVYVRMLLDDMCSYLQPLLE